MRRFTYSKIQESRGISYKNGFSIQFIVNLDTTLMVSKCQHLFTLGAERKYFNNLGFYLEPPDCEKLVGIT